MKRKSWYILNYYRRFNVYNVVQQLHLSPIYRNIGIWADKCGNDCLSGRGGGGREGGGVLRAAVAWPALINLEHGRWSLDAGRAANGEADREAGGGGGGANVQNLPGPCHNLDLNNICFDYWYYGTVFALFVMNRTACPNIACNLQEWKGGICHDRYHPVIPIAADLVWLLNICGKA